MASRQSSTANDRLSRRVRVSEAKMLAGRSVEPDALDARNAGRSKACRPGDYAKQTQLIPPGSLVVCPSGPWRGRPALGKTRQGQDGLATKRLAASLRAQEQRLTASLQAEPVRRKLSTCCAKQSQFPGTRVSANLRSENGL